MMIYSYTYILITEAWSKPTRNRNWVALKKTQTAEPEKQMSENPDATIQDHDDVAQDPQPQTDVLVVEPAHTKIGPVGSHDPPNPKPTSPAKLAEEVPSDKIAEDVIITGTGYTEPGNPSVLAKHSAKEEPPVEYKSKLRLDLESYAHLSAQDIHSGF